MPLMLSIELGRNSDCFFRGGGGEEQCLGSVPKKCILLTKTGSEPGLLELPTW